MILGGPKDTITSIWTKSLKALVPPKSLGPPPMGGVGVDFKDRGVMKYKVYGHGGLYCYEPKCEAIHPS